MRETANFQYEEKYSAVEGEIKKLQDIVHTSSSSRNHSKIELIPVKHLLPEEWDGNVKTWRT